mgnify:CR=1 FL=1|jgi:precorrin-3B methylase
MCGKSASQSGKALSGYPVKISHARVQVSDFATPWRESVSDRLRCLAFSPDRVSHVS